MKIWITNILFIGSIKFPKRCSLNSAIKLCLLFLLLVSFIPQADAQQNATSLSFKLQTNKVVVTEQAFNSFIVKITNNSSSNQIAVLKVEADKGLQLLSAKEKNLALAPQDSSFVAIKIFNTKDLTAGDHLVHISLENANGVLQKNTIDFIVKSKRSANLFVVEPTVSLLGNEDSISIPIQVTNSGNAATLVSIIANLPIEIQSQNFHKAVSFNLGAYKDTLITLRKRIPVNLSSQASFQINIYGFYEKGDLFGQSSVMVQTLQDIRRHPNDPLPNYYNSLPNRLMLSVQNAFTNNAYYHLDGGSALYLPKSRIDYNVDATIPQNLAYSYLRNTYISYETHKMGATLGNINRSFDLNIYGRGVAAFFNDTANKNYYEAGLIDNASNFLQAPNTIYSSGRTAWAELKHNTKDYNFQSVAIYQKDPLLGVNNALLTNTMTWTTKEHFQYTTTLNGSNASDLNNPTLQKSGWLASLSVFGSFGKWNINSINTYSSPYYAGIQKGVKRLSQRISFRQGNFNYWINLDYNNNRPKFVSNQFNYQSEYGNTNMAIGLSGNLKKFNFSISPNYSDSKTFLMLGTVPLNAEISSFLLNTQIGYANREALFYLNINSDEGAGKNHLSGKNELQLRVNSTLNYKLLSINCNLQRGSFYAGDALNSYLMDLPTYRSLNINPSLQHAFFSKKLNVSAGLSYNKINNIPSTSYNASLEYTISDNASLEANISRYQYSSNYAATNSLGVSYIQKLPGIRVGAKKSTLTILFFKDYNNDGIFDDQDSIAVSQEVNIDDASFITNNKGEITYKNLSRGNYEISILRKGQWYAENQTISVLEKKVLLKIPLHRTGTVRGGLIYSFTQYSYDVSKQKAEIRIDAIDEKGKKHTVVTDNYGHFSFFLSTGKYKIYLHQDDLPSEVECPNNGQIVTISANGNTVEINFILKVRERHIETKKFYSSSLTKLDSKPEPDSDPKPEPKEPK